MNLGDFSSKGLFAWQFGGGLLAYVLIGISLYTLGQKAGSEHAWFAWVPILNLVLLFELADKELWYLILMLIPCVNVFVFISAWWAIAEKRGKPGPVALLFLVPCVGFFAPLWIAFSD